jgi:cytochrome b pre-mRNA-processing protein 3
MIPQTILRLFRRSNAATIDSLYGAIVAQARLPVFYSAFGVPDTVEGRFDLLVLHLVLVLRRLRLDHSRNEARKVDRKPERDIAQGLFDAFCRDMDHNLREMGVGDLSVPKEMKRLAEAFYGRKRAYEEALSDDDPAKLVAAVGRNVLCSGGVPADRLASYARCAAAQLDAAALEGRFQGRLVFEGSLEFERSLAFFDPNAILHGAPGTTR